MPADDIQIRIATDGKIYVRIEGASEQRMTDYRRFLEEIIGPIDREIVIDRRDWEKPAVLTELSDAEKAREREQKLSH